MHGPSITPGPLGESVRIIDIPTTIAELLGARLDDVDGEPVEALASVATAAPPS